MDCREAKTLIDDLFDRDLDAENRRALERHLAECELCAFFYEEALEVERGAADLEPVEPPAGFVDRVMARVAAEEQPAAAVARSSRRLIVELVAAAAAGAAITLAVVFGGGGTWHEQALETADSLAASVQTVATEIAAEASAALETMQASVSHPEAISPTLLALAAALAFAVMIGFNFAHARVVGRKR